MPAWPPGTWPVLRGYAGTDLMGRTATIAPITCPFTGEPLTAVAALRPDVTVIHAQRADRDGNVQLFGLVGVQKEAVLAARHAIVTVEEVVDTLDPVPNAVVLPSWVVDAVCEVPGGAHPSFAIGYGVRDNDWYRAWDDIARERDSFTAWIDRHVRSTTDFAEYCRSAGIQPRVPSPA
jgi:glutaconate CoA-transferase subunit A